MDTNTILLAIAPVFGVIVVGALLRKTRLLTTQADDGLLQLIIVLLMPCFILNNIVGNAKVGQGSNVWLSPVVGFTSVALGFAVSYGFAAVFGRWIGLKDRAAKGTFAVAVGMFNYGYVPIPLTQELFGDETLGVLLVHNVGVEMAMWTLGILLISGHVGAKWYRRALNPPFFAIIAALLFNASNLNRDDPSLVFIFNAIKLVGQAAIPLGLLLVGATIADHLQWSTLAKSASTTVAACVLRLGLLPAIALVAVFYLPASDDLKRVMVIEASMPAALFPIVLARHYQGDPATALRVALGTSLVSVITIPLWLPYGLRLTGLIPG